MSQKPVLVRALSKAASIASTKSTKHNRGVRASSISTAAKATKPQAGETPLVILRVQVSGCSSVLAKDRNGKSDPFVVVFVGQERRQTPVVKSTLSPVYSPKDATFDFPIYRSTAGSQGAIEFIVWDKDLLGKDYLGEVTLSVEQWFKHHEPSPAFAFGDPRNGVFSEELTSTKTDTIASGTIEIKLGFMSPDGSNMDFNSVYSELLKASSSTDRSVLSGRPNEGIGTAEHMSDLNDDGICSDDEYYTGDDSGLDAQQKQGPRSQILNRPPTASQLLKPPSSAGPQAKVFSPTPKRPSISHKHSSSSNSLADEPSRSDSQYNLSSSNDILGIIMLEVNRAEDLPKLKNMTRTGWDMDPFTVISFGKKVFRTRVIRHSLNPVWDEKLLIHVRRYESNFHLKFAILDWDKLSGNDHVGDCDFPIAQLRANVPQPDPNTGIYPEEVAKNEHDMQEYKVPIVTPKGKAWELNHSPFLTFHAKFQPYAAVRQRFWRQYLKQYDSDNSSMISNLEMTSMLDSLGSTLSPGTIDEWFTRFNKRPHQDELTFDEAVQCLEEEVGRPRNERKRVNDDALVPHTDAFVTPTTGSPDEMATAPPLGKLDFSGPAARPVDDASVPRAVAESNARTLHNTGGNQVPLVEAINVHAPEDVLTPKPGPNQTLSGVSNNQTGSDTPVQHARGLSSASEDVDDASSEDSFERVINIKTCPLCHRPRMNAKAEMDIVTHLAVCASGDWARVDRIVVGNFVTASQAQRKWYTKVIAKVSTGSYYIGANSANIIVQNRMTGQLEEEKMQGYVRLGIRLLYKGAKSQMEGGRARKLLKSLSVKQGTKYDSPESAREIEPFIAFHNLPRDEIRDPLDSFKTFNEFFYRKLKVEARPVSDPHDPTRLVSGADCRLMAFETVNEATKIWIKGKGFTVDKLLGPQYADDFHRYNGGALVIFRLAPQDYHRYHVPVDGKIGPMTEISGEYYTVNPQAIRTSLDVYGENIRKIVPIDSPTFGRVMCVCIGAMMVGSIVTTVKTGDEVKRGDEFGYFAFGGSTIVVLFETGVVEWDEDLLINGRASLETLVRVNMGIGRAVRAPPSLRSSSG